ncbi:DUF2252 family protein [uncultured Bradyrhizobium sp.]|uniref:DUF2252 family protein n=1 Tax=uncultured Bradyrhizobium sp. TaxID=199684 RepID=UPI0035C9DE88
MKQVAGPPACEITMSFVEANAEYETWLKEQCDVVDKDLAAKHERMKDSPFMFLRATYFRWAKSIPTLCPELADAPEVLAVGDLHLENFGTWRDADGRLVWGVNDFDEAAVMPYVLDLVRLATSIRLAPDRSVPNTKVAHILIAGYREGLQLPQPALLDEGETWLRSYAIGTDLETGKFWKNIDKAKKYPLIDGKAGGKPPRDVMQLLKASLPTGATGIRYRRRIAGGGSLGRPRYVAIADWRGGRVMREAKALVPSAWTCVHGAQPSGFLKLARGQYRAPDPFLDVQDGWILRRLAPDSRKIELDEDAATHLKDYLLQAMAFDLASIHAAGSAGVEALRRDLKKRPRDWLFNAAKTAADSVRKDYEEWRYAPRK